MNGVKSCRCSNNGSARWLSPLNRIIQEAEREAVHLRQQEIDLQHGGKPYERSLVQIKNRTTKFTFNKTRKKVSESTSLPI